MTSGARPPKIGFDERAFLTSMRLIVRLKSPKFMNRFAPMIKPSSDKGHIKSRDFKPGECPECQAIYPEAHKETCSVQRVDKRDHIPDTESDHVGKSTGFQGPEVSYNPPKDWKQIDRPDDSIKETNPKSFIAGKKVPLHLISPIAKALLSSAAFLGEVKYGRWNWRAGGARASTYYGALQRHMDAWYEGEELDSDGTLHLANALACICILAEAQYRGQLEDDRPPSTDLKPLYADIEGIMSRILSKYGDRDPKHWTIKDKIK
jgi:hypothetical protein